MTRIEVANARRRLARRGDDPGERPQPGTPAGTECLPEVGHIVVLMMENHSYDNYLGMLAGRGDGLALDEHGEPVATNPGADGTSVRIHHFKGTAQEKGVPTQSWHGSHIQWDGGSCDGFVRSVEELRPGLDASVPMTYWTEQDLPFYYGLARTFPLATRWFSSCLGPTFPNRRFLVSGTAHGLIDDKPFNMVDHPARGTIFDLLEAHGITWVNYHHLTPVQVHWRRLSRLRGLNWLRALGAVLAGVFPQFVPSVQSKLQTTASLYPLGFLRSVNHLRSIDHFWQAARTGRLPSVSVVDPDFRQGSEENPQDIQVGEAFAAQVINAVMSGPAWPKTLLIWLYDEHGGYYDHVPPPAAVEPDDVPGSNPMQRFLLLRPLRFTRYGKTIMSEDAGPAAYDRLGFRVPAVIVSPYARPGYVTDTVYDHTSVLKLIETKWNLPPLTRRDAAAAAPLEALDFSAPPQFLRPPVLPGPARPGAG
ncbi:MAG TPA: alkaline phosphatase family protein [Streptosporangiaceae bacterium]|nr:alkaline phosphatase family protein [Streptosporangiaceae bacterium]